MATIKTIQENEDELWKTYTPKMNEKIAQSDAIYDKQAETTSVWYDGKIGDAQQEYDDLSRQNEVQKYINAREVAENNANLGLTDSGLNRTQQTAVQLSASNKEAKIQRARQSAVDELRRLLTADLAEIEGNKSAAQISIKDKYENLVNSAAVDKYKADWDAETARIQEETKRIEAEAKAKQEAENALLDKLTNNEITKEAKNEYVKKFVSQYGITDFLKNYGDGEGYRITATGELTDEPISVKEFDRKLYNKNIQANNGKSYINPIVTYLESQRENEGRTFIAEDFLIEMTANSFITPEECSLLLYNYINRNLDTMYDK